MASQTGFPSVPRVSSAERTAGTEANERRFSPLDIATMANLHYGGIEVEEESVSVNTGFTVFNFLGAGVTATDAGGNQVNVTIPGNGSVTAVSDEGTTVLSGPDDINFAGAGVTVANDGDGTVTVTIPGGGSGSIETKEENVQVLAASTSLNFLGTGVTATDGGGGETDITIPGETFTSFEIEEEGVSVNTNFVRINFVGAGVTATDATGGEATVTIPGGGGSSITVQDEGTPLTTAVTLFNFAGAGVTVTEPTADQVLVTIPGGGSGIETKEEGVQVVAASTSLNFLGTGVTASDGGANETDITIPGLSVEDDGSSIVAVVSTLDFTGAGVTVTDTGAGQATVNIPGGGGGGTLTAIRQPLEYAFGDSNSTTASTSAYATKGQRFTLNEDIVVFSISANLDQGGAHTLQASIVGDNAGTAQAPLHQTVSIVTGTDSKGWTTFNFNEPVRLTAGNYAVLITRTDGTATDQLNIVWPVTAAIENDVIDPGVNVRKALNAITTSSDLGYDGGTASTQAIEIKLNYARETTLTEYVNTNQTTIDIDLVSDTKFYRIIGWVRPQTDIQDIYARFTNDGFTTVETGSVYKWLDHRYEDNAATAGTESTSDTKMVISDTNVGNATIERMYFDITIHGAHDDTTYTVLQYQRAGMRETTILNKGWGASSYTVAEAINGIQIYAASGNIDYDLQVFTDASLAATAGGGGGGNPFNPSEVTASRNLTASDFDGTNDALICNSASDIVLTLPSGLTPTRSLTVFRKGTGEVDIAAGGGVTILSESGNLSIDVRYNALTIFPTGTSNEYALVGKIKA